MKCPPYDVSHISSEHPLIARLLAYATGQITELPDFTRDREVAIFSDFGGEHKGARLHTYSFLIISYSKIGPFMKAVAELRRKHKILEPYSEFAYKDLHYGPRKRALPGFLEIVDTLLHGALITLVVDKNIESLFGKNRQSVYPMIKKDFNDIGLSAWKFEKAEKALRISHAISFFASLLTHDQQKILWYCDNDAVNESPSFFDDTKTILCRTLGLYLTHEFNILGFAKSFEEKSHLDDLLSIADLSAGIIYDLMTGHHTKNEILQERKLPLIRWLTNRSAFLTKITIQMLKLANGDIGSSIVSFNEPSPKS